MTDYRHFLVARKRFYECEYPPARAALWADVEYYAERCGADISRYRGEVSPFVFWVP